MARPKNPLLGFIDKGTPGALFGLQEGNYDKTYYLEPGEGGAKAYALLRRAMEETGRIAIARIVIRSKESLAAIRVFKNGVLAMETMHFPDEVRSPAGLTGIVEPDLRPQELEMATNLIASLAGDFEPEKFQNEYRQALLEVIGAKVAGEEVVQVEQAPERGRVVDLMDALRASIRLAETARGAEAGAAPDVAAGPAGAPGVAAPVPGVAAPVPGVATPAPSVAAAAPPGFGPAGLPAPGVPGAPAFPGAPGVTARPDLGPTTREGAPLPGAPSLAPPGLATPPAPGAIPGAPAVPPPAFLPPEETR